MEDPRRRLLMDLLNDVACYGMRSQRTSLYDEYGTGKMDAISYIEDLLEEHLKEFPLATDDEDYPQGFSDTPMDSFCYWEKEEALQDLFDDAEDRP